MSVLFIIGLAVWMAGFGLDAPFQRVAYLVGAVLVVLSPVLPL